MARQPLGGLGRLIFRGFTITLFSHTTLGRTPLDEGPARRRDLYLTTRNTHKRQTSISPVGFEPTIPRYQGSIARRGKRFFSSPNHSDRCWSPPSLLCCGYRGGKAAGAWSWPPPCSGEIKNVSRQWRRWGWRRAGAPRRTEHYDLLWVLWDWIAFS
jgi:hypothetical protein